jgi:hypothetical protein
MTRPNLDAFSPVVGSLLFTSLWIRMKIAVLIKGWIYQGIFSNM